jgi:YD repeat-containing protein
VSSITTPAGKTSYTYDAFGRNVQIVYPDSVITTRTLQRANPISGVRYKAIETTTNKPTVTTYYTSDNKPLYTERTAFGNKLVYTAYSYYPNGAKKMVSEPYFSTSIAAAASQTFTSDNATFCTYDEYNRPLRLESPEGTTLYTYNGLNTAVNTPTVNKAVKLNSSGFTEYEQTGPALILLAERPGLIPQHKTVSYTYYPTGQVKTATPDGGSVVTMEYDVQGNRTKLIDPDAGTITNTYNAFGQVLSRSQSVHLLLVPVAKARMPTLHRSVFLTSPKSCI